MKAEFPSFKALSASHVEGRDFVRVRLHRKASDTVIIAPHAGRIEPFTGSIAAAVAGEELSLYAFRSRVSPRVSNLHITSHRFDEPDCVTLVGQHARVVAIHGCKGALARIYIGGRDKALGAKICAALQHAGLPATTTDHRFLGSNALNICNRGLTGKGVQLELSRGLRRRRAMRSALVSALRKALL